jgi:predicted permease
MGERIFNAHPSFLPMIRNHLRAAWRNCWAHRSVTLLNIAGLSAGMTAAILIFLWIGNETSYDSYHPGADRIYRLTSTLRKINRKWGTAPLPLADDIRAELPQVEKTSVIKSSYSTWFRIGDEFFEEKKAAYVGKDWFELMHYDFVEGDAASFMAHPFSLALTEDKAKQYFGNRSAIGRTIRIDTADYEVRAVIKNNPSNSSFQYDVLMPLDAWLSSPLIRHGEMTYDNYNYAMFVRLREGTDPVKTAAKITSVLNSHQKGFSRIDLEPLRDMHFDKDMSTASVATIDRSTVYIFSALGIFLLVIACINYVNLTTARASLRAKEVSVRKIVGADKRGLFVQFILESLLVSVLALVITLLLVRLSLPLFDSLTGKRFADPLTSPVLWKIVAITLLTATALNGVYPALFLSSFNPLNVFRGSSLPGFRDVSLRKGLVILQFTFSIILVIATIVIRRQLDYIQTTDPGYNRAQVFSFSLPWTTFVNKPAGTKTAMFTGILHDLSQQSGIADVCMASESLVNLRSSNSSSADWEGHDTSYKPTVYQLSADEDYRRFFDIRLAAGRWFEPANAADQHNFILNETAVNDFGMHKPVLGQRFSFQGDTGTIIGVVKDFHYASMHTRIAPMVIFNRTAWRNTFFVKAQPGHAAGALAFAKTMMRRYNPGHPFIYSWLDDEFATLYRADQKLSGLILTFSVIAVVISCMGLFGLAAFAAGQRKKEIGIRKILGASVSTILLLLSRDFIRLVLVSIIVATPLAGWMMYRWLQDFAYRVPLGAGIFVLAAVLAVGIALLTISFQSVRAAMANPVDNLRTE